MGIFLKVEVNNMSDDKKLIKDDNIKKFIETVKIFCDLVENNQSVNQLNFLHKSLELLMDLIHYGFLLPNISSVGEQPLKVAISQDYYIKIQKEIANIFGKYNYYWFIYDSVKGGKMVGSTLSIDIADIYKDLKNGLVVYLKGNESSMIDAVWHWRFGVYNTNWGMTAVNAMKAIYNIITTY